jgi:hypothetical protein
MEYIFDVIAGRIQGDRAEIRSIMATCEAGSMAWSDCLDAYDKAIEQQEYYLNRKMRLYA